MNLLFIAPCLEPGKDGVGDYTYQLSEAINSLGYNCYLLAWNDHQVSKTVKLEASLRLPSILTEPEKISLAKDYIGEVAPDWISLQWVPHGYHPKGLFNPQIDSLKKCIAHHNTQLMIHEIWLGAKSESSLKEAIYGIIQRRLFRKLINQVNPKIVHTQAKAYQLLLKNTLKRPVEVLPLFGNIRPVKMKPEKDSEVIRAGFFGSIHPETELDAFAEHFIELGKQTGKQVRIEHAGRCSHTANQMFDTWKQRWQSDISFCQHGPLEKDDVSKYLYTLHFGLSANPIALTDKSGSIAAMLEHDLPIIKLRNDVSFKDYTPSFDKRFVLTTFTSTDLLRLFNTPITIPNKPSLESVATQFMERLTN